MGIFLLFSCSLLNAQNTCVFNDSFESNTLNALKWWDVNTINPLIGNSYLILTSNLTQNTKSDIQSLPNFNYCCKLDIIAKSSHWASGSINKTDDTSIGLEMYYGKGCHDGIVITNGVLGILRAFPIEGNICSGDPIYQKYIPIPNWNILRKNMNKYSFIWTKKRIDLIINDSIIVLHDSISIDSIPNRAMKVRLNCNVDFDFNQGVTADTLWIDEICVKSLIYKKNSMKITAKPTDWHNDVLTSTGINVEVGDKIVITASGTWNGGGGDVGPDGGTQSDFQSLVRTAHLGALVGRIGRNDTAFMVGHEKTFIAMKRDTLFLGYNDNMGKCDNINIGSCYDDNKGILSVDVTVNDICLSNGISENSSLDNVKIYPNPTRSIIIIEITQLTKENILTICNINGQELIRQQVKDSKIQIDISNLTSGIYFVKLITDKTVEVRKIIKE